MTGIPIEWFPRLILVTERSAAELLGLTVVALRATMAGRLQTFTDNRTGEVYYELSDVLSVLKSLFFGEG